MSEHDIAIIGAGMHPWGKWGRNFVEYGVVAARAALADAEQLEVGMAMELVLGPLYEDDEHEYVVWQWAPTGGAR